MRPRFGRLPKNGVVPREAAPVLYALADEAAAALGTGKVGAIVIDHHFNASSSTVGVRRTRVLTLGLPLLAVLPPEQRVALVAHELAHARNGDATRGFVVGSAVGGLLQLYRILEPEGSSHGMSQLGFVEPIVNAVFWLVSRRYEERVEYRLVDERRASLHA